MTVRTKVVEGKVQGHFSFECSQCGPCGGNYPTVEDAHRYADIHTKLPHPKEAS
jgi:hypothetical protein